MSRPGPHRIDSERAVLYWSIAAVFAALGVLLVLVPLFPWHTAIGAGWLALASLWVLMPLWVKTRQ